MTSIENHSLREINRNVCVVVVRHLRDVPVVHVAVVTARARSAAASGAGAGRAERLRHVLDQLVSTTANYGTYPTTLTHTPCLLCSQDQQWYTTN
jgi:putative N-acetylmannosamine-6-phosphate epimerase